MFRLKIDKLTKFETAWFRFGTESTRKIQETQSSKEMGIIETVIAAVDDYGFTIANKNLGMATVMRRPLKASTN